MLRRLMSLLPERNTKFSASVMVLGVISSKGDIMPPPPPSLTQGQRAHAKQYIKVLDTVVKPWMLPENAPTCSSRTECEKILWLDTK
jgi:hypothetical protein